MVILELIHALKSRPLEGMYLLDKKPMQATALLVIHSNFSDRTASRRRQFIQISALSAFDGTVVDYRGING